MDQVKKNETKEEELNSDICLKIAEEQTINDWIQLKGKLYIEKDEFWDNAFSFFEKRIYSRYINPIDEMLKIPSKKGEGFAAVAGMEELKQQMREEVIEPLHNPEEYHRYGVTIPNGMLLYGPPGCGKTFFAKHFAEEVGFNFM